MIGIILALAAATCWGTGDFLGGLSARKLNQFQVLLLTSCSSFALLSLLAVIQGEGIPTVYNSFIAAVAGICGALGLAALYRGLSLGNAALIASVAAVIGAIIPTLAGILVEGLPTTLNMIGFILAIAGIWLVTQSKDGNGLTSQDGLGLAILAGIGFGGFLALIAQIEGDQVLSPLVISKLVSIGVALTLLRSRQLPLPRPAASPIALWSGFLDASGNLLYLLATQLTRLDVAALLASLYPAVTVLLSTIILKDRVSSSQWLGAAVCIVAIILITAG